MCKRRLRLAADDRWRLVDEGVVLQGMNHEEGKVNTPRQIARQDGILDMLAPDRQSLARAFFEVTASHHRPPLVAGENAPACLDLVLDFGDPHQPNDEADDREHHAKEKAVDVLAILCNVPAAGEHEACPRFAEVQDSLRSPTRVLRKNNSF